MSFILPNDVRRQKGKVGWKARERKGILASHMKRYVRERYECTAGVADTSLG